MTLEELADACEKATGPSIGLDHDIARAIAGPGGSYCSCNYTASLDAAMTLVPEGWSWNVANLSGLSRCEANAFAPLHGGETHARAETPALALTAAALRSHAQKEDGR
jgi:hypothetical protein